MFWARFTSNDCYSNQEPTTRDLELKLLVRPQVVSAGTGSFDFVASFASERSHSAQDDKGIDRLPSFARLGGLGRPSLHGSGWLGHFVVPVGRLLVGMRHLQH